MIVEFEGKLKQLNIKFDFKKKSPPDYTMGTQYVEPLAAQGMTFYLDAYGGKIDMAGIKNLSQLENKKIKVTLEVID